MSSSNSEAVPPPTRAEALMAVVEEPEPEPEPEVEPEPEPEQTPEEYAAHLAAEAARRDAWIHG